VIALAGSEEKLAVCREHGAELALDYTIDAPSGANYMI